jgi:hypothetical protein
MAELSQSIRVLLSNGKVGVFTGKVLITEDEVEAEDLYIEKVEWCKPRELPEGCAFEVIHEEI